MDLLAKPAAVGKQAVVLTEDIAVSGSDYYSAAWPHIDDKVLKIMGAPHVIKHQEAFATRKLGLQPAAKHLD